MIHEQDNQQMLMKYISDHKLSMVELSSMCGVSPFTIRNLLSGVTKGTRDNWKRIQEVTNIPFHIEEKQQKQITKQSKKKTRLPKYIKTCLRTYGNTVISNELIAILGIDTIIELLKAEHLDVIYVRSDSHTNILKCKTMMPTSISKRG